uniref:Reverse transcriptase Ty1/copia-type domain-containing protein n=1 Tax=Tanacetum cinerariifolium TaxID=118510 RepID=A0A6L2P5V9_TANCI|nr:hypothetical protein [Tanacetum cinerariifolium]
MGELTFFLGLQVKQKKDGIFISQDKYVAEILRKFRLTEGKSASTLIDTEKPLLKDPDGEDVDVHTYMSMISSLMYLTSSRPDIMFVVCACACFQVTPKASHLHAVKRIFRYLKGKPHLGLWYQKDLPFDLVAYSDSDYAGASLDKKSTTGGWQTTTSKEISNPFMAGVNTPRSDEDRLEIIELMVFLLPKIEWFGIGVNAAGLKVFAVRHKLLLFSLTNCCCSLSAVSYIKYALTINPNIYVSCIKQFWNTVVVKQTNDVTRLQAIVDRKKVVITEAAIRDVLRLDDAEGVDCLPNEEIFAELAHMDYEKQSKKLKFYKAFFSSQWKSLIYTILQSMSAKRTSWNKFSSIMAFAVICLSTDVVDDAVAQRADTAVQGDDAQEPFIPSPTPPTPSPQPSQDLSSTSQEVLDACTVLTIRVEHLEYDKVAQALEITKLKRRVKKLEKENRVKVLKLRSLKKVGSSQRIDTLDDTVMEDASNQGRMIDDLDKDDFVTLMDDKEEEKKEEEVKDDQVQGRQAKIYKIDMDHASKVLSMQEDEPAKVQEVVDVVTIAKLITEVVTAASETVTTAIRFAAASTRRRKRVVIKDSEEESTAIIPADTKSKDKGKEIMVEEPKPLKKKQQIEMDEEYARKFHEELNKDIDWDVAIEHVKQKAKEDLALILLVERRYPLSRFTLDQMLNVVRLRVEEQSEMSLELLSFGVDAAMDLEEKHQVFNAAGEELTAAKQKVKDPLSKDLTKLHDSKIKNRIFNVGDQVLLFNSHLKIFSGKLKTRWPGPFTITQVFSYGTIELSQPNGPNFKVNGHRVKHYFEGDIPSNVVPDLHTFPMDK